MRDSLDPPVAELTEELIEEARAVAWKHWHAAPYVLEFDELLSLAYKGLSEAAARWPVYCQKNNFDPERTRFYKVYCGRRMNGAILDYMRAQDWVGRTVRNNARSLRDAGQGQGASEADMSAATGLSRAEVSQTLAAMARRPVGFDPAEHDVADIADTESQAVTAYLLDTAVSVLEVLPVPVQFAAVLTFYCGLAPREAAKVLGVHVAEAAALQQQAAIAVHGALAVAAGRKKRGGALIIAELWRDGECAARWTDEDGPRNLAELLPHLRDAGWLVQDFRE